MIAFADLGATYADLLNLVERVQHLHAHAVGEAWQQIDALADTTRHALSQRILDLAGAERSTVTFAIDLYDATVACRVHPAKPLPVWLPAYLEHGAPPITLHIHCHTDGGLGIESPADGDIWLGLCTLTALYGGRVSLTSAERIGDQFVWTIEHFTMPKDYTVTSTEPPQGV